MTAATDTKLQNRPATKRRVRHIYDREAGELARQMGVQVRMLCGVWDWPAPSRGNGLRVSSLDARFCQRCVRSVRAWEAKHR